MVIKKIFYISVVFIPVLITGMEQVVKIKVGDKFFELTKEQVHQSKTLEYLIKDHTDVEQAIVLPSTIRSKIFSYIFDYLKRGRINFHDLEAEDYKMLFKTARALDIADLVRILHSKKKPIIVVIEGRLYYLTLDQLKYFKLFEDIVEHVGVSAEPIEILEGAVSADAFEYIYDDVSGKVLRNSITASLLGDVINAAFYLGMNEAFLEKYINAFVAYSIHNNTGATFRAYLRLSKEQQRSIDEILRKINADLFWVSPFAKIKEEWTYAKIAYFSPDKKTILVPDEGQGFSLIDVKTREEIYQKLAIKSSQFAFSKPDGNAILSWIDSDNTFPIYSIKNKSTYNFFLSDPVLKILDFFLDGTRILASGKKELIVVDSSNMIAKVIARIPVPKTIYLGLGSQASYDPQRANFIILTENECLTINIENGTLVNRIYINPQDSSAVSLDGEKIALFPVDSLVVKSSFDENAESITIPLPSNSKVIKHYFSPIEFSLDGRFVSFVVKSETNLYQMVADLQQRKIVVNNVVSEIKTKSLFSPNSRFFFYVSENHIQIVDLYEEIQLLPKSLAGTMILRTFISDEIFLIIEQNPQAKSTGRLIFYNIYQNDYFYAQPFKFDGSRENIFDESYLQDNWLVLQRPARISFFDMTPIVNFSLMSSKDLSFNQLLFINHILEGMKLNKKIEFDTLFQKKIYATMPQVLKMMVQDHNRPFVLREEEIKEISEKLHNVMSRFTQKKGIIRKKSEF